MIKQFILNLKFVKDKIAEAEKQGGIKSFPLAQKDVLETMNDDIDKKAEELSKKKLNDLLSVVDLRKIVTLDKARGIVYIGGMKADDARLANLKSEAEFILESDLWDLISETPKELAQRSMFVSGETLADMAKGKSMLHTLSVQKNIIDTFKGYVGKTPNP